MAKPFFSGYNGTQPESSNGSNVKASGGSFFKGYSGAAYSGNQNDSVTQLKAQNQQQKKKNSHSLLEDAINFVKDNIVKPVVDSGASIKHEVTAAGMAIGSAVQGHHGEQLAKDKAAVQAEFNKSSVGKAAPAIAGGQIDKKTGKVTGAPKFDATQGRKAAGAALEDALNIGSVIPAGGAVKGAKLAAETAGKTILKTAGKTAAEGAAYGAGYGGAKALKEDKLTTAQAVKDIAAGAGVGAAAGGVLGGAGATAGKLARVADAKAGKTVESVLANGGQPKSAALTNIGEKGVVGGLNKTVSDAGRKVVYGASDLLGSTKLGSKLIGAKDSFMSKWTTDLHPLYKTLKRSDFEGSTNGAYLAAREAVGNSNRALSYAQHYIDTNPGMKTVAEGIQAKGPDLVANKKAFDEFAKVKSELDLHTAGRKEFSEAKLADLQAREAKLKDQGHDFTKEYDGLVQFYRDLNDFRLQNGLISKEQHAHFASDPVDYVRQQRELPQWMKDKPGGEGGSVASITKSGAIQKRSKYASAELLSPTETAIRTAQQAHVEAYRNQAAKTLTGLLSDAGEAKVIRSTDMVQSKRALLNDLAASKPLVMKLNKVIRSNKNQINQLSTELNQLNRKGIALRTGKAAQSDGAPQFDAEMLARLKQLPGKSRNARELVHALVAEDPKGLAQIRTMIEGRNEKLGPLFDKLELASRDLHDLHQERSGIWHDANGIKTTVDKHNQTTLSFLDDGVENVVKVDPTVASAVHNWDKQQQNVMSAFLRVTNNVFKYGTTGANAGFALPNFVADQLSSAVNSRSLMATHNPKNFVHALMMTIGKPLNAEDAAVLDRYTEANKGALSINQYTKPAAADKAANELLRQNASTLAKTYTFIRHPREGLHELFRGLEGTVGLTENLTRIQNYRGTYNQAVREGKVADAGKVANQAARENSVDFLEMGSYGRVVNSFIPYFNASIQGSRTLLRNAAERPVSFAAKTAALVGMPVAMSTMWNLSDPKRAEIYKTIPDYVKETNFVIIGPNAQWDEAKKKWDGVFMLKKPQGYTQFAEPVRKYLEYAAENGGDFNKFLADKGGSIASDFASSVQPIDFSSPNKFLSSVTPQALKPTAEAILNKNFFTGQDIVKGTMQNLPADQQKYAQYSQLTSHIAGMFGTSPLKVDQWIKDTFGEVGTNAVNAADRLSGAPQEAVGGRSIEESISRRFVGAPGGADTDAFYKSYNPALQARTAASKRVTELVQQGNIKQAQRAAQEYNDSLGNRFGDFFKQYQNSPNYDQGTPDSKGKLTGGWDDKIKSLYIPVTTRGFAARKKAKK